MDSPAQVEINLLPRDPGLEERLREVLGSSDDPVEMVERRAHQLLPEYRSIIWEGDPQTFQFTFVSSSAEWILGYPVSRWLNEPTFWVETIVHPADRNVAVTYCALATGRGLDHDFSYRARAADGRTVRLHDIVRVIKGRRGIAVRLRGVMVEVPERPKGA